MKNISDILFEQLILEATKEEIYNQYYKEKFSIEDFNTIIAADPTSKKSEQGEVKKMGKYSKWLLSRNIKQEDLYKATKYLDVLNRKASVLKRDKISTDINKYKKLSDLFKVIEPYIEDTDDNISNSQLEKTIKKEETKKIYEDDEWIVVVPESERSACYYGKGTQWCTASTDGNNYFDYYNDQGQLYININKKDGRKYQFHFESGQFMDETDSQIQILDFIENNEKLSDFYTDNTNMNHDHIEKKGDKYYLIFNDWSDLSIYFKSEDQSTVDAIFGEDSFQYFELYDWDYSYAEYDITNNIKKMVMDHVRENYLEDIQEWEEENDKEMDYDDLIENDDFGQEYKDAIANAHSRAKESANESEAWENITDSILNHFGAKNNKVLYDEKNKQQYIEIDSNIAKKQLWITTIDFGYEYEEEDYFKISFDVPYHGWDGNVDNVYFEEELENQLENI